MPAAPRAPQASFAAELRAGDPACRRGLWLTFLSPFGLEVAAACGAEWIAIDVQHGDLDLTDVAPLARVSPVPVLVRLGSHDEAQLARALDAGIDGVIVPAVESAAQAGQLVQAARFPPRGRRSKGLARVSLLGPRDQPLLLPMIETRAGLDHLDDILGVDGVDGIFVGPYDLALSLGQQSVLEGVVVSAIESVIDRTRRRGRITGIFTGNRELTGLLPAVDLLGVDTDAAALRAGLKQMFVQPRHVTGATAADRRQQLCSGWTSGGAASEDRHLAMAPRTAATISVAQRASASAAGVSSVLR